MNQTKAAEVVTALVLAGYAPKVSHLGSDINENWALTISTSAGVNATDVSNFAAANGIVGTVFELRFT